MSVWLRSQDRLCLVDTTGKSLLIEEGEDYYMVSIESERCESSIWLGDYDNLDIALSVLDEIQGVIADSCCVESEYDSINGGVTSRVIQQNIIVQMPEVNGERLEVVK